MMKSKAMVPLVLGAVVGLVAIKFGVDAIRKAQGTPTEMVTTVRAVSDIPASVQIRPEMLEAVQTPKTPLVPQGCFASVEELVGRVASKAIPQGSVVLPTNIAPKGTLPGISERIEEGFRAVSVKIDEVTGVAGQVNPGDFVDVIVVMDVKRDRRAETISRIILQRVKVAAVGQSLNAGSTEGSATSPQLAKSVTLLVKDVDVPRLHLAQTKGRLTLAMRGADDRLISDDNGDASSAEWDGSNDAEKKADEQLASAPPTTPAERIRLLQTQLGKDQPEDETKKDEPEPFDVTVINGPLASKNGAVAIQKVTYKDRNSMEVVMVGNGRSGAGPAASADSAESIMRAPREEKPEEERFQDRDWSNSDQPQDREIPEG
jgi:pilus assembly protein CpaB